MNSLIARLPIAVVVELVVRRESHEDAETRPEREEDLRRCCIPDLSEKSMQGNPSNGSMLSYGETLEQLQIRFEIVVNADGRARESDAANQENEENGVRSDGSYPYGLAKVVERRTCVSLRNQCNVLCLNF